MTRLFTYCMPTDQGSAPNPFWGVCTLVICKPRIRLNAQAGDWVVGTGSANSTIGDIRGHVVYAMKVTQKMSMAEYDAFCAMCLRGKVPDLDSPDWRRHVGDSIYDYSTNPPLLRPGVHDDGDRDRDLLG